MGNYMPLVRLNLISQRLTQRIDDIAEDFERKMRDIWLTYQEDDEEVMHIKMDALMCETLEKFRCHAGVKIFRDATKWYA